jgi:hypothetical protein
MIIINLILIMSFIKCINSFQCLDEFNHPIDSWNVIKEPSSYDYYVFNSTTSSYNLSPYNLSQTTNGCVMNTGIYLYIYLINLFNKSI